MICRSWRIVLVTYRVESHFPGAHRKDLDVPHRRSRSVKAFRGPKTHIDLG
jgi:hypothetical protein